MTASNALPGTAPSKPGSKADPNDALKSLSMAYLQTKLREGRPSTKLGRLREIDPGSNSRPCGRGDSVIIAYWKNGKNRREGANRLLSGGAHDGQNRKAR